MKKLIALFILGLAAGVASAQSTAFTATIIDTDGTAWDNGSWTASIYSPLGIPFFNGAPLSPTVYSGTMNGSGVITVTLPSNTSIAPSSSQWRFLICPNASAGCSSVLITVTGTSQDGSATLSAGIIAPRFSAGPYAYGYTDAEVSPTPLPGGVYFNSNSGIQRIWNGTSWANQGGGGGSGVSSINAIPGAFTFTGSGVSCSSTTCTFSGGGGGGAVSSVFGRTGAVVAAANDYSFSQLSGTIGNAQFAATVTPNNGHIILDTANGIITAANSGTGEVISDQFSTGTGSVVTAFGTAASATIGTSGGDVPLLNAANTWSALQTFSAALSATLVTTTSGCPGSTGGGCLQINEGTSPTGVSGVDVLWGNTSTHRLNQTDNNGTAAQIVDAGVDINTSDQVTATHLAAALPKAQGGTGSTTIPAGIQTVMATSALTATTCEASFHTASMTGLLTTDSLSPTYSTSPSGLAGWGVGNGVYVEFYPTANTLNYRECNGNVISETPAAMTLNWGITSR